jgi:hypothetical protein
MALRDGILGMGWMNKFGGIKRKGVYLNGEISGGIGLGAGW